MKRYFLRVGTLLALLPPAAAVAQQTRTPDIIVTGRGLEPADMPVVREIVRNAAKRDYSLISIVLGIVDSYPFQMRTNGATAGTTVAQTKE